MASGLWATTERAVWSGALSRYSAGIEAVRAASKTKKKEDLPELDRAVRVTLAESIAGRSPRHITQPELSTFMRWKMMRGKFRPRLQQYADSADDAEVARASTESFRAAEAVTRELLTDPKRREEAHEAVLAALAPLTALKGVGPATASGLLSAANAWLPFMVDEGLELVGERRYTPAVYADFVVAMAGRAVAVGGGEGEEGGAASAASASASSVPGEWTPRDVAEAIWAAAHSPDDDEAGSAGAGRASKRGASGGKAPSGKRGRGSRS